MADRSVPVMLSDLADLSDLAVAALLLLSGGLTLTAALGLWRLPDFFQRMHAPALTSTLASWAVALASVVHAATREGPVALHVWVIPVLLSITAPVSTLLLARAALFRGRQSGDAVPPPVGDDSG